MGLERVISCWQVGDVLVDPGPESASANLLAALGDERPRAILLTHIHLDHAGATGALVRRWPDLEVYVHEIGAPHVADPTRLLASASRLYGAENMGALWGEVVGVPQENIRTLSGGETLPLAGGIRVLHTPGHASHHVVYLHEESGQVFTGDAAGVKIPPSSVTIAPTPPPEIDVEAWEDSLDRIAELRPTGLGMTHFGLVEDALEQLEAMRAALRELAEVARDADVETTEAFVRQTAGRDGDPAMAEAYEIAMPANHIAQGIVRYWRKRDEREAAAPAS